MERLKRYDNYAVFDGYLYKVAELFVIENDWRWISISPLAPIDAQAGFTIGRTTTCVGLPGPIFFFTGKGPALELAQLLINRRPDRPLVLLEGEAMYFEFPAQVVAGIDLDPDGQRRAKFQVDWGLLLDGWRGHLKRECYAPLPPHTVAAQWFRPVRAWRIELGDDGTAKLGERIGRRVKPKAA